MYHYAHVLSSLHRFLTKNTKEIEWTPDAVTAFHKIKEVLAEATLLNHPKPDTPLSLETDASDTAIGAVLQQYVDGMWQPISYYSRTLTHTERRYSNFDRELLAIHQSIKHFRYFLEGLEFRVLTDHKPLTHIATLSSHPD